MKLKCIIAYFNTVLRMYMCIHTLNNAQENPNRTEKLHSPGRLENNSSSCLSVLLINSGTCFNFDNKVGPKQR